MKLRAKKIMIVFDNEDRWEATCESGIRFDDAMSMIAKTWKEYDEPKEPLIKDEKIRKAIRAWLAIQEQPIVKVAITRRKDSDGFFNYRLYGYIEKARISDGKPVANNNLVSIDLEFRSLEKIEFEKYRDYTIEELCGAPEPLEPSFIDLDERIKEKEEK